jgi:type VI secretion system secreted protein VgrG
MLTIPTARTLQEAASNAISSAASQALGQATQALFSQFTAAFKQTNRLLRLHTPLGANVLLAESFKGIECISGAAPSSVAPSSAAPSITGYLLQIDALSTNAHLQLKQLIGQPLLLELQTDQHRDQLRPFHGHITSAISVGSNGGMARYRLTVQPWLAFLGAGRDSAVFQDMNVLDIVQSIFTDYQSTLQGQGKLQPQWRLEVQDAAVYPIRSLTTQYNESDLQFVERLLLEEGLFYWFEHTGDAANATLGQHTLVIADHNGAFKPLQRGMAGANIRFSQSKGTIQDDTIDLWSPQSSWSTHAVDIASWDYRQLSQRPVSEHSASLEGTPALISQDTPGAYAYESAAQGQRLARNQLQALQIASHTGQTAGSIRLLAPGQTFTLTGHPDTPPEHITLHVIHHARNNLSAQLQAQTTDLPQAILSALDQCISRCGIDNIIQPNIAKNITQNNTSDAIFYRNTAQVLPQAIPYRASRLDGQGQLIHPKPSASGSQTALVIGVAGQHLTTDRDHRVKVQFAWQRGTNSQSRLQHPAPESHSGAPAQDGSGGSSPSGSSGPSGSGSAGSTTGTWVRVATPLAPIAGANWGSVALPRIGQEVLITFLGGDIDRPVIIGSLYNGQGADNQQTNQIQQGAANATGNAPMWFPGDQQASGKQGTHSVTHPGHAHSAVLSGIKTQALSTSQTGQGGYNQIVFDDSPGQSRLGLQSHGKLAGSHAGESELNLGALRHQTDNQRLSSVGYGFELKTHYSGAIRSGSGLLISADKRAGNDSGASSHQMDSQEAQEQLSQGQQLIQSLTETAQQHKAMLPVLKTSEAKPEKLPVMMSFAQMGKSLQAIDVRDAGEYLQAASEETEDSQAEEKFDEQIQFVNANGATLAKVRYTLVMADGSTAEGVTDSEGRTKRVVTENPQAITQASLKSPQVHSCCEAHAQDVATANPLVVQIQDVNTNSQDLGTSVKQVKTEKGKSRPMTVGEIAMAQSLFGTSVDYASVKVHNGEYLWFGLQQNDTAMTPNGQMYYPKDLYFEDFSTASDFTRKLLFMHEMVHIWQYQLGYPVKWVGIQRWRLSYAYILGENKLLSDFDMEAQGNVLSDYWALKNYVGTFRLWQRDYVNRLDLYEEALSLFLKDPANKENLPRRRSEKEVKND